MESHKKEMNEDALIDLIQGLDKKAENQQLNIRDAFLLLIDPNFQVGLTDPNVAKILESKLFLENKAKNNNNPLDVKKLEDASIFENMTNCYKNADLRKVLFNFYETDVLLREVENKEKQKNESKDSGDDPKVTKEIADLQDKIKAYSAETENLSEKLKGIIRHREIFSAYNQYKDSFGKLEDKKNQDLGEAQYKAKIENAVLNLLQCKVIEKYVIDKAPPVMQVSQTILATMDQLPLYIHKQNEAENKRKGNTDLRTAVQGADDLVPLRIQLIKEVMQNLSIKDAKKMEENFKAMSQVENKVTQNKIVNFIVATESIQADISKPKTDSPKKDRLNIGGNVKTFISQVGPPHKISIPIPQAAPGSKLDISTITGITKNYLENKNEFFKNNYPETDPIKIEMLKFLMDKICDLNKRGGQPDKVVSLYAVCEAFRKMDFNNDRSIADCEKTIHDNLETLEKFDSRLGKAGAAIKQTFFSPTKDSVTMSSTRLAIRKLSDFIEANSLPEARKNSSFRK